MDYQKILDEAYAAAKAVQADMEEQLQHMNCGFAWVTIDGREPFAFFCRKKVREAGARLEGREQRMAMQNAQSQYGSKAHPTGHSFWCPGSAPVQDVAIHEAGANAFRDSLAKHGIRATVASRLD